jgi:hypothetical protein
MSSSGQYRNLVLGVDGVGMDGIQAPKLERRIMRYEFTDSERGVIRPMP